MDDRLAFWDTDDNRREFLEGMKELSVLLEAFADPAFKLSFFGEEDPHGARVGNFLARNVAANLFIQFLWKEVNKEKPSDPNYLQYCSCKEHNMCKALKCIRLILHKE